MADYTDSTPYAPLLGRACPELSGGWGRITKKLTAMKTTRNKYTGAVLLCTALLLFACSKSGDDPAKEPQYQINVYVAGNEYNGSNEVATYWKNGNAVKLGDGTGSSEAASIVVSGEDVYIAGRDERIAMYWKNNQPIPLSDGSKQADAKAVFISNRDIYISGNERDGSTNFATYWKNGITETVEEDKYTTATSIFVAGGNIYVSGNQSPYPLPDVATYWKDGVPTILPNGHRTTSIFVENGNVHVVGVYFVDNRDIAIYWRNGTPMPLTNGTENTWANAIVVHKGDVYIAGSSGNSAVYWKNGDLVNLTGDNQYGRANSIFVFEDDIYVAGAEYKTTGAVIATYWKNGKATSLTGSLGRADASSIFVTKTLVE